MDKNRGYKAYNKFVSELLVDESIREEVITKISSFLKYGNVCFEGNNLFGKCFDFEKTEYLEIKYDKNGFVYNHTEGVCRTNVKITQYNLKQGNVKVEREEQVNYDIDDKHSHENDIEILKRIYSKDNVLIYEEKYSENRRYIFNNDSLLYSDSGFGNKIKIEKQWNISNGSIIQYRLRKDFYDDSLLEENYYISEGLYRDPMGFGMYYFDDLDKDLFELFMTGKITIKEVIEKTREKNKQKEKIRKKNNLFNQE